MRQPITIVLIVIFAGFLRSGPVEAQQFEQLQRNLEIVPPAARNAQRLDLANALRALHVPSVDIALIDHSSVARSRHFGAAASNTIYQAASLSKLVSAVAALRLVERGALSLDRDVKDDLASWRLPETEKARADPVTLRRLLSMTAGIGVPGYLGYEPGAPLPSLSQILDGLPPARSPPVRVEAVPGSRYAYSGGSYELVQAMI
ncbi:MAG: beta-lactamase family protein, partial [Alphaproteobacteria bacterium]|nr:beta-lactamase family protein [Alphaproteobacteria bacterium]